MAKIKNQESFDHSQWLKDLGKKIRENPNINKMPKKLGIHTNGETISKVKIEDMEV